MKRTTLNLEPELDRAANADTDPTRPAEPTGLPVAATGQAAGSHLRRSVRAGAIEVVKTLALAVVIFFVVQAFVAQPFQVQQLSMQRTFEPGDYVLVDKLSPRWDAYSRGDVIVFEPPEGWEIEERAPFIKRVIGIAGDTVEVRRDGLAYVNGTALEEPYRYATEAGVVEPTEAEQTVWFVTAGELFVMGDHRRKSADSRVFGAIPVTSVIGRAIVRYWPLGSVGMLEAPAYPGL